MLPRYSACRSGKGRETCTLGTEQDPRLLVAGGGGGGGGGGQISTDKSNEGDGGWGGNAGSDPEAGWAGKSVSNNSVTWPGGEGGGAGTSSVGGAGGSSAGSSGGNGTAAVGGDGGLVGAAGGGGGGGYFGGGGGGAGSNGSGGGGGGAGSSFVTSAASNPSIGSDRSGAPRVVISYPQPAPAVTPVPASGLSTTSATLGALVDPSGADTVYRFEYWTNDPSSKTDTQEGTIASADGVKFVSVSIDGLEPDTTYHYRPVATNSGGTTIGAERAFTTATEPPPPNAAPAITVLGPAPGSNVSDRTPNVRAKVTDSGTELSKDDVRLWVDGRSVGVGSRGEAAREVLMRDWITIEEVKGPPPGSER